MKYTIEKLADLEIIKTTVVGRLNLLERKEIYSQAISELKRNGYNRLLFDGSKVTLSSGYTYEDSIEISNYMQTFEVPKNTKIAFLSTEILLTQAPLLAITKTINEHIAIRHFTNYENAIKWLGGRMPYEINWEQKGVFVRFWDTFDYNANVKANIDIYRDPRSNYLTYVIWDTSKVTESSLTEDEISVIAEQELIESSRMPKIKKSLFAPDKNIRSMCEQYCAHCQSRGMGWEFMVSDSMKSIRTWIDA